MPCKNLVVSLVILCWASAATVCRRSPRRYDIIFTSRRRRPQSANASPGLRESATIRIRTPATDSSACRRALKEPAVRFFDVAGNRTLKEIISPTNFFGLAVDETGDAVVTVGRGKIVKWA